MGRVPSLVKVTETETTTYIMEDEDDDPDNRSGRKTGGDPMQQGSVARKSFNKNMVTSGSVTRQRYRPLKNFK